VPSRRQRGDVPLGMVVGAFQVGVLPRRIPGDRTCVYAQSVTASYTYSAGLSSSGGLAREDAAARQSCMAILDRLNYRPCVDPEDPDDYRPRSSWAVAVDPQPSSGSFVVGPAVVVDRCAPGDKIPLHTHTIDEVVLVQGASAPLRLGNETRSVPPGAVMFVPRGTPHGSNPVDDEVTFIGIFGESIIETAYLERNPAPGTEGRPPLPRAVLDARLEAGRTEMQDPPPTP
jgi:hypothetical protein